MQSVTAQGKRPVPPPQAPGMHRAQKHESRQLIEQMEEKWRQAILSADSKTMASLLADDYVGISANGMLQSKDETLEKLSSGKLHFTSFELSERKVRFYGATAVVTAIATVQGSAAEGELAGNFRYMRVYVRKESGQWQIVSFEISRIREGGEKH